MFALPSPFPSLVVAQIRGDIVPPPAPPHTLRYGLVGENPTCPFLPGITGMRRCIGIRLHGHAAYRASPPRMVVRPRHAPRFFFARRVHRFLLSSARVKLRLLLPVDAVALSQASESTSRRER